jgi:hypothetical protein
LEFSRITTFSGRKKANNLENCDIKVNTTTPTVAAGASRSILAARRTFHRKPAQMGCRVLVVMVLRGPLQALALD